MIADDHALLRSGLRRLVSRAEDLELVGEAADGFETERVIASTEADVLLLDLNMPKTDVRQLIAKLSGRYPRLRILVLTGFGDTSSLRAVLSAGASGVCLKSSGFDAMFEAIKHVHAGHMFVDPALRLESTATSDPLNDRERAIVTMLARGASYRDVGLQLHIGERTVETYRRRIAERLGLKTRAELVTYALRQGLLTSDSDFSASR